MQQKWQKKPKSMRGGTGYQSSATLDPVTRRWTFSRQGRPYAVEQKRSARRKANRKLTGRLGLQGRIRRNAERRAQRRYEATDRRARETADRLRNEVKYTPTRKPFWSRLRKLWRRDDDQVIQDSHKAPNRGR